MSKTSKKRQSTKRREERKRRKLANYIRYGPKAGALSKKKKVKTVGEGKRVVLSNPAPVKTSAKGRKRRRKNGTDMSVGGKKK